MEYGFSCDDNLENLLGVSMKLSDVCCGTCAALTTPKPKVTTQKPEPKVCNQGFKGDDNCDDVNNHVGREWDGGDCCPKSVKGGEVKTKYCDEVA